MKKPILLLTISALISLAFFGCSSPSPSRTVIKDVPDEVKEASQELLSVAPSEGQNETLTETAEGLPNGTAPSSLIVKSENAVTEAERQALLSALNQELDTLIQLLDDLESVEDADLDLSGFE
ncbi:hypothetical protein [Acidaminobacter hydrogenoformans]|uniref:Uncharacterized protein n=1 Tax=Acidaminobacter hydrogenoformans DSM 2784 TaxID=1120920 RepID=A0A1G5S0B7_9FIRM|nr:hypothetical protein [Acidaminobacter hydrogenoformans]SCZ79822.1 hypothetical protein SAMN03080599_01946 [Acidaminobacter hydrogenoformans DSM 2784]